MSDLIRLACSECDRDDHDMIRDLPDDWEDVCEVQTWEQSIETKNVCLLDWWTHIGLCPECLK